MLSSTIVKCKCGTNVNIPTRVCNRICPKCDGSIAWNGAREAFFVTGNNTGLVFTLAEYHPSSPKYFNAQYPKLGQIVTVIKDNQEVILDLTWSKEEEVYYEGCVESGYPGEPKYFSWVVF